METPLDLGCSSSGLGEGRVFLCTSKELVLPSKQMWRRRRGKRGKGEGQADGAEDEERAGEREREYSTVPIGEATWAKQARKDEKSTNINGRHIHASEFHISGRLGACIVSLTVRCSCK